VGLETRESLLRLFPTGDVALAAEPPITTTSSSTTTTSTTVPIDLSPIVSVHGQFVADEIDATTTLGWEPFGRERLNILLLGGDAGPGRRGLRTDTMIVVSIDPISGDAALIGVPRNYGGVTLSDGTPVPVSQIGHVYGWGTRRADLFAGPDPGAAATVDAVSNLTGLQIDHFVLVDLTGFADVVDAFGGVGLDVEIPVDGPLYDVETGGYEMVQIPAGSQHLDGDHALAYARARYGSSDYVRMGRQRCILASMAAQADLLDLFGRLGGLLDAVEANLTTDIPMDTIPDLIRLTPRVSAAGIRVIGFDSKWGTGRTSTGHVIPDIERIREAVRTTIEDPGSAADFGAATAETGC
jgi:LCP family protein required for cell wall assembly